MKPIVESHNRFSSGKTSRTIAALLLPTLNTVTSYQHHMARLLFEISRLDGLGKIGTDRRLPMAFRVRMQKVMKLYDESVRYVLGQLRDAGFRVQCTLGCAHCCHQMPTGLSSAELILIYHGMQQNSAASRFFRRCLEAEELWVEVGHRREGRRAAQGTCLQLVETLSSAYGSLEQPCPFLEANLCQIYPFRPLACRMHFSLSPPSWCRTSHFQNPYALSFNLEPGKCVFDALEGIEDRLQLDLSDMMICGLLELTVNVMQFEKINWER